MAIAMNDEVDDAMAPPLMKRMRTDGSDNGGQAALVQYHGADNDDVRLSSLPAPTLQLSGHTGSVYAVAYNSTGTILASTSFDKQILLWSHENSYANFNVLSGHKNAVLDCAWLEDSVLATCSADKTVMVWDVTTGTRLRKWPEHTAIVNAVDGMGMNRLVSGGDDGHAILWDVRAKPSTGHLVEPFPLTAVAATTTTTDQIFTGGLDNLITCWDVKMMKKVYSLQGHTDTITSLALHPEGSHLLSNSMDHTLQSWNVQAFVGGHHNAQRHVRTFTGHKHNVEKGLLQCAWKHHTNDTNTLVTAGSADRVVHVWDDYSGQELYTLPGHKGCIHAVCFHPHEPVVVSGASDRQIFVGELS